MQGEKPKPSTITPNNEYEDYESEGIKTLKTWREMPPTHYILKIESFSSIVRILEKTRVDNYESNEFNASGHRWKLLLYPGGDERRNGSNHISLYLKIMNPQSQINALLTFFVYNQVKDKYLSIQDTRVMRFDSTRTEQGLSQLVSLKCFTNASNGLLIKDICVFGVEIFDIKSKRNGEGFSTLREQSKKAYVWNVEKFSGLKETGHFSEPFSVGGFKWKLHLYGKGTPKAKGKYLSIYLCLQDDDHLKKNIPSGWKMHVEFKLSINDQVHENNSDTIAKRGNAWFSGLDTAWGFPYFIKLADLKTSKGLILRDAIEIEVQIISMSMATSIAKNSPMPS